MWHVSTGTGTGPMQATWRTELVKSGHAELTLTPPLTARPCVPSLVAPHTVKLLAGSNFARLMVRPLHHSCTTAAAGPMAMQGYVATELVK